MKGIIRLFSKFFGGKNREKRGNSTEKALFDSKKGYIWFKKKKNEKSSKKSEKISKKVLTF